MSPCKIPQGKKRYYITLTEDHFEWLKHLVCEVGSQPKSQIAMLIDEMIGEMKEAIDPILKKYEESGQKPSWADFHLMLGKQLQKIGDEDRHLPM